MPLEAMAISRRRLALILGLLAMVGPFAIDTYLPAFAGIGAAIGATPVQMQQTLSSYLLGFAVMNLFHGALADPPPGSDYMTNFQWCCETNRFAVEALADALAEFGEQTREAAIAAGETICRRGAALGSLRERRRSASGCSGATRTTPMAIPRARPRASPRG